MSRPNVATLHPSIEIRNEGYWNYSYYYKDRLERYYGFYMGISGNEYSDGLDNFPSLH